jgi:predicted metal-dependent enzyme (double-stranded beta helix superfamily)
MFNLDNFIESCKSAVTNDGTHLEIREIVEKAVSDPESLMKAVGEPSKAGASPIFSSSNLTIVNVVWAPWVTIYPHNHNIWAVIGIYSGREDNIFWRRISEDKQGRIEAAGARSLCLGDVTPLGPDIIHSVNNPIPRNSGAIHIYGGDFFHVENRSEWDPEDLTEHEYNAENVKNVLESFSA